MANGTMPSKGKKKTSNVKSAKRNVRVKRDPKPEGAPTKMQVKQARKEKLAKGGKISLVVIGIAAMLLSVTAMACSGVLNQATDKRDYELTGGVAATVNGVNIKEDTITTQIMALRESAYESDEDWATFLADQGLTPESYRENLINSYARQYLISEAERENNITVSQEDVDKQWESVVAGYDGDEEAFLQMLSQIGYDKDSYKESLKSSIATDKLKEAVAPAKDPTDEEIIAAVNENLDTYNGARRSSHILFKVAEDATEEEQAEVEAKAQKVLDDLNAGKIEFTDAAKEYSEDSSADNGGDVGWDKLTTFVDEYQTALSGLSKGEMSGLVKTTYGYHIIMCTDLFSVDGEVTSIDQVPKDIQKTISSSLKSEKQGEAYDAWFTEYVENADIVINKMPENVPYNVDMSKAKKTDTGSGSAE